MSIPVKINGYEIVSAVAKRGVDKGGHIILVDRGPESPHRWVTAFLAQDASGWDWGHYFASRFDADADFNARVARGY